MIVVRKKRTLREKRGCEIMQATIIPKSQSLDDIIKMINQMSWGLNYALRREHLDNQRLCFLATPPLETSNSFHFLCLEQIGKLSPHYLIQLQTALAASHAPDKFTLLFAIASDGYTNRIYLGMRGHTDKDDADQQLTCLSNLLKSNFPGVKLRRCQNSEIETNLQTPLINYPEAVAITGIPDLKDENAGGELQSIDKLLRGMEGKPFVYLVIADALSPKEVDNISYRCRELLDKVHLFSKFSYSENETDGYFQNSGDVNADLGSRICSFLGAFPPIAFLGALAATGSALSGSKFGTQVSEGSGNSRNFSKSLVKEYISSHAQLGETTLQKYLTRFDEARVLGCWRVGTYFFADKADTLQQGGFQLRALLSGENSKFEPIRIHSLNSLLKNPEVHDALTNLTQPGLVLASPQSQQPLPHPLSDAFQGLTTLMTSKELPLVVNFPTQEVTGVQIIDTANFTLNPPKVNDQDILLGRVLQSGDVTPVKYGIPLNSLSKHAIITGTTGGGKSTTILKILTEVMQKEIPFLVIEPAKTEYLKWAMKLNEVLPKEKQIAIYAPGCKNQSVLPLHLNPFEVVRLSSEAPEVLSHIDRLKSILIASFPMQEILPLLLEELIFHAYTKPRDWLSEEIFPLDTPFPTISQMIDQVNFVVKSKGYAAEVTANLTAALMTRLQSLKRGWKRDLFDRSQSTPWEDIFSRPVVINLSYLGDDNDKAFTMAILWQFLYEYRQAQQELGLLPEHSLNHLAVIEEAHRILSKGHGASVDQANPQGKVAETFSHILSEIRAYGQGILLVDQVPNRLIPDAIKQTNLKIVHRLLAQDDKDSMRSCMNLTDEQGAIITRLRPGEAIAFGDLDNAAAWIKVM